MENILVLIIAGLCGLLFLSLGYFIWIKGKINLIHSYHYTNVREADKKAYTGIMGKATILMGAGMILSGIVFAVNPSGLCGIAFGIPFCFGLCMMMYAQLKYNHEII